MKTRFITILRISLLFSLISLVGCASIYSATKKIPGLDRIISSFSKAEVGPIKDKRGEPIQSAKTKNTKKAETVAKQISAQELLVQNQTAPKAIASQPKISPVNTLNTAQPTEEKKTQKNAVEALKGSVFGKVKLLAKGGVISPQGVIVRLNRADGMSLQNTAEQALHEVDMVEKVYEPGNIVIRKGDTLNFVNKDLIQHNVFSSSGKNSFDLGTFGSGLQRTVKLNQEGVVKLYCNIHPKMAAYVAVDDAGLSQVVNNENGDFEFKNLPIGDYTLTLWSIRGTQTKEFTIISNNKLNVDITFDTSHYKAGTHLDKFGKAYKKSKKRKDFY